jgi:uncharacterized membrane protein YidH (DUF202 family)
MGVAALVAASGLFVLAAFYVLPGASGPLVPDGWGNVSLPWTYLLQQAAPGLLTGGFALAAALLFARARLRPESSKAAKFVLLALGIVLIGGGIAFLFAPDVFAQQIVESYAANQGTYRAQFGGAWSDALVPAAPGLLVPGLGILAGLALTAPKRAAPVDDTLPLHAPSARHEPLVVIVELGDAGPEDQPVAAHAADSPGRGPLLGSGWIVGAALLALGAVFLFAPTIFPGVPPRRMGGTNFTIGVNPWTQTITAAASSFILVGVGALAVALLRWIRSGQNAGAAENR